nr:MAG TPA: hypothetical protein [Caudoviricetes sp.]
MYFLIVHVRVHGYLAKTFFKKRLFWFDSRNSHYISVSSYHSRGIGR